MIREVTAGQPPMEQGNLPSSLHGLNHNNTEAYPTIDVISPINEKRTKKRLSEFFSGFRDAMRRPLVPHRDHPAVKGTGTDEPFGERLPLIYHTLPPTSGLMALAFFANMSTYELIHNQSLSFPGLDKVSDVTGPMYEPLVFTRIMKTAVNAAVGGINRVFSNNHDREIFLHRSLTRKELLTAISWYGGLWLAAEISALGQFIPSIGPLGHTRTTDFTDIPAYFIGLMVQHKLGKEIIKRFPPGRFEDMERSVAIMLQREKSKGTFGGEETTDALIQSFGDDSSPDEAARRFLGDYKKICLAIKNDLLRRTKDVRGYIEKDGGLNKTYQDFIRSYTFTLSRKWFTDQLEELREQVPDGLLERHQAEFERKKAKTKILAKVYRAKL